MKTCNRQVKYQYAWGGKIQTACEDHTRSIKQIAAIIGSNCDSQLIESDDKCKFITEE